MQLHRVWIQELGAGAKKNSLIELLAVLRRRLSFVNSSALRG